jgi:hypothetical protein
MHIKRTVTQQLSRIGAGLQRGAQALKKAVNNGPQPKGPGPDTKAAPRSACLKTVVPEPKDHEPLFEVPPNWLVRKPVPRLRAEMTQPKEVAQAVRACKPVPLPRDRVKRSPEVARAVRDLALLRPMWGEGRWQHLADRDSEGFVCLHRMVLGALGGERHRTADVEEEHEHVSALFANLDDMHHLALAGDHGFADFVLSYAKGQVGLGDDMVLMPFMSRLAVDRTVRSDGGQVPQPD